MGDLNTAYHYLFWGSLIVLSMTACACLFRAIIGPRFTDRIVSVNIISTKTIIIIAILSVVMGQEGLLDVAMVYALISFLAVVVLSKCYLLTGHRNLADGDFGRPTAAAKEEPLS